MQHASPPHLEIKGLAKHFAGGAGVVGVDMIVPAGAIIGVNGAGTSTTLCCVIGLLSPVAGQITLFGRCGMVLEPVFAFTDLALSAISEKAH